MPYPCKNADEEYIIKIRVGTANHKTCHVCRIDLLSLSKVKLTIHREDYIHPYDPRSMT